MVVLFNRQFNNPCCPRLMREPSSSSDEPKCNQSLKGATPLCRPKTFPVLYIFPNYLLLPPVSLPSQFWHSVAGAAVRFATPMPHPKYLCCSCCRRLSTFATPAFRCPTPFEDTCVVPAGGHVRPKVVLQRSALLLLQLASTVVVVGQLCPSPALIQRRVLPSKPSLLLLQ